MRHAGRWHALAGVIALGWLGTALPGAAPADAAPNVVILEAILTGAQEVPPVTTTASGLATVLFDATTRKVHFVIAHDVANPVAAHFHGNGFPGTNAAILIPIGGSLASPIVGEATLTESQAADLLAGRWYLNIHSVTNQAGEVRGQLASFADQPISVFPRSGILTQRAGFDLVLVVSAPGRTMTGATVTLNGGDVSAAFLACARPGTIPGGQTLRCSVPAGVLAPGRNFVSFVIALSDETSVGNSVTWDVEAGSE
jgi:hypothetical protein